MKTYFLSFGIFALLCGAAPGFASTASICDGVAGNLVQNCGFEFGNFSDWTVLNDDGNTNVEGTSFTLGGGVNSGNYYATLGDESTTPTTLEQTFSDTVGSSLTFSFYLATDGAANDFTVDFDGTTLLALPDAPAQGYTEYSFAVTGTGSDTISFSVQQAGGWAGLDDVVVVDPPSSVPEPSFGIIAAAALGLTALARRRLAKKSV